MILSGLRLYSYFSYSHNMLLNGSTKLYSRKPFSRGQRSLQINVSCLMIMIFFSSFDSRIPLLLVSIWRTFEVYMLAPKGNVSFVSSFFSSFSLRDRAQKRKLGSETLLARRSTFFFSCCTPRCWQSRSSVGILQFLRDVNGLIGSISLPPSNFSPLHVYHRLLRHILPPRTIYDIIPRTSVKISNGH